MFVAGTYWRPAFDDLAICQVVRIENGMTTMRKVIIVIALAIVLLLAIVQFGPSFIFG
jgi:hypothetical protein